MNQYFVQRSVCPGCGSSHIANLCDIPYTESPIRDYLAWYYKGVGPGVELEYLKGARYILDECLACGLVYQQEIPGTEVLQRLYERWLDPVTVRQMERVERGPGYYLWIATELSRVLEFLGRPPSEIAFLDFGMGWGHWCLLAKGFGCSASGAELSDVRSAYAEKMGITVLGCNELPTGQFDFINAEQVFEHLADPLDTLLKLAKALKPGGVIRLGVPTGWDIKARLRLWDWNAQDATPNSLNAVAPLQHINCFNFQALHTMGVTAGLRELELPDQPHPVESVKDVLKLALRPIYRRLMPGISRKRRGKTGVVYFTRSASI
ncbi:MAG: class I SAM-dependent methyltransferase [Gallionella sp.]|nr:class I SAM-dependent methyltransferase [Gallionella sp.]